MWQSRAACVGMDTDMFIVPNGQYGPGTSRNGGAIEVCDRCPVRTECLDAANAEHDEFAVRGGLLPSHEDRVGDSCPGGVPTGVAAEILGITTSTVRHHAAHDTLVAHHDHNGHWCIHLQRRT